MICSPLLQSIPGVMHSFGTRSDPDPPIPGLITVKQVHGTYLYFVEEHWRIEKPGYDILMTSESGTTIGVKTADCLPILIVEPEKKIVAAAHAGWRGTAEGVVTKAVSEIVRRGGKAENLSVALGPCIGRNCYEVEQDVVASFKDYPDRENYFRRKSEEKWLLDLQEANRLQLITATIRPEKIDTIDLCTHCRPDLFHSWRRDGQTAGRMVNWVRFGR